MNTFNGTLNDDNLFVLNLWRTMYVQLQQSFVGNGTNPLPDILTVNNALQANMLLDQPTAIPLLIGQYNSMDDNALNNGLLTFNNSTRQLNDVPNRPNSPYLTKNLFAACPLENFSTNANPSFIVKSSLNYNNTGLSLSSVQIDFANGQGFVNMPLDVAVNATYTDTGYYRWKIKATLSNNTVLQCYADYYLLNVTGTSSRYASSGTNGPIVPTWGTIAPVNGVHNGGTIHIVYSKKSRTNTLRKPLIVVENMDAYTLAPQVQIRPYGISDFIDVISNQPGISYDFNGQLDDIAGYDLVFINFNDGMDGIVNNAAVVQEAINRVNTNKVPDDRSGNITQQNVVLGLGTGGLNARYALANMAKNFSGSNTRLLITHDAPHRGQNIALGLQYLVKFINKSTAYSYNWGQIFPEHAQTVAYFNAKVSKDVLIYKAATEPGDVVENSFIESVYQPMVTFTGNSQPYQFVATSLGNECANPLFTAGREFMNFGESQSVGTKIKVTLGLLIGRSSKHEISLFSIPLSEIKFETQISARSIPNQNALGRTITVYKYINKVTLFGSVYLLKNGVDLSASAANTLLPIDGVPGSFNTLLDFTELRNYSRGIGNFYFNEDEYIATLFKVKLPYGLALKFSVYGFFKASEFNTGFFSTQYTSVPVGSALDVNPFNSNTFVEKYVNGINQNYPSKSHNFIAQETVQSQSLFNNVSMRFTPRNARFLFKEMELLPNLENCSGECSNPYYLAGQNLICTTSIFTITGLPRGATVTWSASPSSIVNLSCTTCTSTTLTKVSNGIVTLTATLNGACGGGTVQLQKTIQVGTPVVSWPEVVYPITSSGCLPMGFNVSYQSFIDPQMPNGSLIWGYYEGATGGNLNIVNTGAGSGTYQPIRIQNTQQYNRIYVAGENECGVGTPAIRIFEFSSNCDGGPDVEYRASQTPVVGVKQKFTTVNIFPNPATNRFSITLPDNLIGGQLMILSLQGKIMKSEKVVTNNFNVEATNLASGVYIVEIKNKGNSFRQKILIAR